ncbi:MAG: MerR family transcriptional regulator [Candidatus Eremiobacteraeota bacterium]|nr:MerR family transcriptional regulator [Candidatus Eremiobacteraeota bacterium]
MAGRYKIKTVAERCGFSATLLRAWERRYDFLEPERLASGHRLYTDDDLKVLKVVKLLLDRGQSVGEVAALGRDALLRFEVGVPLSGYTPMKSQPEGEWSERLLGLKERLVRAVAALDSREARLLVESVAGELDSERLRFFALDVSREVGRLWASGELSVASEHLLSSLWTEILHRWMQDVQGAEGDRLVVCAGFPDEFHELGLLFLSYELRRAGHQVVYLGPALPFEDLDAAVARIRPHVVCLSVSRTAVLRVHLPRFAESVSRQRATTFVVGGSGVEGMEQEVIQSGALPWVASGSLREAAERLFT